MNHDRVMLLIDADNVSLDVIEQAVPWVHKHYGGPHVRRAYCTAESAVKHQAAFKRLSIRPMVNLAAGKNSTDIALAVDAIDLAVVERPEVVVIASSDSDFAPLVSRLREKGCRVVGIGQEGKTGGETIEVYDDFEVLAHRKAEKATPRREAAAPKATPKPARKTAARARKTAVEAAAAPTVAAAEPMATPRRPAPAAKKAAAPRKRASRKTAAVLPEKAQAILDLLPALAQGETVELRVAAERLRDAQLLSRSGSTTKLLGQFPEVFELLPEKNPNHVRRRPAP
ncbi:MAG TPA: NYN domain-containing protein [Burkholderiaceae bacterium]|nr:NYN domain-containing protein [Burkholderiaceae bacterium]